MKDRRNVATLIAKDPEVIPQWYRQRGLQRKKLVTSQKLGTGGWMATKFLRANETPKSWKD